MVGDVSVSPSASGREPGPVAVGSDDTTVVDRLVVGLLLVRHRERSEPGLLALDVGAAVLVDHALDALADLRCLGADRGRALARRDRILVRQLPRALGRRAPHRVVGEKDAAVAQTLLDDLGRSCRGRCRNGGEEER